MAIGSSCLIPRLLALLLHAESLSRHLISPYRTGKRPRVGCIVGWPFGRYLLHVGENVCSWGNAHPGKIAGSSDGREGVLETEAEALNALLRAVDPDRDLVLTNRTCSPLGGPPGAWKPRSACSM